MRKRAQKKDQSFKYEPKHIVQKPRIEKKTESYKKNWWIAVSLIAIFFLVLFLNSYFNITSEISINPDATDLDRYYLSGPDPYYNLRLVENTLETGEYPFYKTNDPLLNYPIGSTGGRPPLLNMMALGFSRFLVPFMEEIDAVGYSMQFVPALFGALIVFPVYFIGKTLFGKKEGLIAALLIALIPIHIGSGHGSAYSLFDHDSLNLLLFFLTFYFLIKGIKEKEMYRSILFGLLSGLSLAALYMTWVQAQFVFTVLAVYTVVQIIIDIFKSKYDMSVARTGAIAILSGYLISLPVLSAKIGGQVSDLPLILGLIIAVFGLVYYILQKRKIPWTISLTALFIAGGIGLVFLYYINDISRAISFLRPLTRISEILYGSGIYGSKVAMTIAEAGNYNISRTVMSFGPALYWLGMMGFLYLIYKYYKEPQRRDYLFFVVLFIVELWLAGTAGRFLNDLVPLIAIFGGWIIWMIIDKIDYKQMIRNIKSAGGGLHGLRRGVKAFHIFGILFVAFLIILPNTYLSLDAAVPNTKKEDVFGPDHSAVFGLGHGKEAYWVDAFNWLNQQDAEIEDDTKKPAFISWWDYGFYEAAIGDHPTVADNFQDGIPPAANFHTATSEQEAVAVWITRLLRGNVRNNQGEFSPNVIDALEKYVGENNTKNITQWIVSADTSPSYGTPIAEEYNPDLSQDWLVGGDFRENAYYHDITHFLTNELTDEEITWLYHDIQETTGYSIRYYGVEGYDKQIFNIFGFLSDKSLLLVAGPGDNPEDDFVKVNYILNDGTEVTAAEVDAMTDDQLRNNPPINTKQIFKNEYFNTMFYRTYVGPATGSAEEIQELEYQLPCMNMKHFCGEYISDYYNYSYYTGKSAVVIAKYYEGAYINGSVTFMGNPVDANVVVQKNITHYGTSIPIDHDKTNTVEGDFNLIAPAGEITIQVQRYPELGMPIMGGTAFILKNVTFSDPNSSLFAPITDAEAMRRSSVNERILNITIDPGYIEGYIYIETNDKEGYNLTIDEPIEGAQVFLHEVTEFTDSGGNTVLKEIITTDENGYYNASDLMPGVYAIRSEKDDYVIRDDMISIKSGTNSYNMSMPLLGSIKGKAYYDKNRNDIFEDGEKVQSETNIVLTYEKYNLNGEKEKDVPVTSAVTGADGSYEFTSLIPGRYRLNSTKLPKYATFQSVTLQEGEEWFLNISLDLTLVTVSGHTKYGDADVTNVTIGFLVDLSVKNNTALGDGAISNSEGRYEINLMPGSYNVSARSEIVNESGINYVYTYTGQLEIKIAEGLKTHDIALIKEESES